MITLYTAATPNGYKVSVALEELELPYDVRALNLTAQEQKEPWFLAICPNGRIPAILDDGLAVWESGAILIHLAEKTGRLLPTSGPKRTQALAWLMFQMSGIGPMMGQANVFYRYFPEKIQPAIDRYQGEVRRLFGVLDRHLADHEYLAGEYSIADIANWCWTRTAKWSGVDKSGFTHLQRWEGTIAARPAAQHGILVPEDSSARLRSLDADGDEANRKFAESARSIVEMGRKG